MKKNIDPVKYSSAITLSDMEIFVFPELMYSLVLANLMSPIIWQWRNIDTFQKLLNKPPHRRLARLRQFIMDEFEFNLDLNTWGLTDKNIELERFAPYISKEQISESNALFGYHGDEYYFDIGIRNHFGLDKYHGDIIPYWKTETLEAMDAFKYKQTYTTGAGECVSLGAVYIAAAFIVCDIPLEDMYMILTPLHSQNFIDLQDGFITNNRRVITKPMWFNGTAITEKAQRALRNENVTIVSHPSGYIHCLYEDATIDPEKYAHFASQLRQYLTSELDITILANFMRNHREFMKYFAFCRKHHGKETFIRAEVLFRYEHNSNYRIAPDGMEKLYDEVSDEDFNPRYVRDRICIEKFVKFWQKMKIDLENPEHRARVGEFVSEYMADSEEFLDALSMFLKLEPSLPSSERNFLAHQKIEIPVGMGREDVIEYLQSIRASNTTADLAFYAYRDIDSIDWEIFMKALMERSPISIEFAAHLAGAAEIYDWLEAMENKSIYNANRLSHPDEVVNFLRGDGVEKALTMANILHYRYPQSPIEIEIDKMNVVLKFEGSEFEFHSLKKIQKQVKIQPNQYARPTITDIAPDEEQTQNRAVEF